MLNAETIANLVLSKRLSYRRAVYLYERFLLLALLKKFKGNKRAVARFIGSHPNTIYNKLRRGIK